jgi:hypothetical protein
MGSEDAKLEWIVTGGIPRYYNIYENDAEIISGESWQNGVPIVLDLRSYPIGQYIFRIYVRSSVLGSLEDEVNVSIVEDTGLKLVPYPSVLIIIFTAIYYYKLRKSRRIHNEIS